MERLIADLLDYSRVGQTALHKTPVALDGVFQRIREQQVLMIREKHADIIVPAGANVARLLGATVSVPAPDAEKLAIAGTVTAIVQQDEAPNGVYPGVPGIITLSAAPTIVPPDPRSRHRITGGDVQGIA